MIALGALVRDRVTGVRGQAIGRSEFLYSSSRIYLAVRECDTDGKPAEPVWFDEARLERVEEHTPRFGLEPQC